MPVTLFRLTPIALAFAGFFAPQPVLAQSADPPPSRVEGTLPEPGLKTAPRLTPPILSAPDAPGVRVVPSNPPAVEPPAKPAAPRPPDEGAVFLRADRIEGSADKAVEASGKVELRTRRETVLADWLQYNILTDEIWAKGDVLIRYGFDWIAGPEVKFKRTTETGFFTSPKFFVAENNSRGSAAEIRFAGPDHYEASDARYTT
jgi:LPS-assembly protein